MGSRLEHVAAAIAARAPRVLEITRTPGLSVAIADTSGVVIAQAFGTADLAKNTPMTPAHTFAVGSVCKPFIMAALMQLVQRREVQLYGDVNRYIGTDVINPFGGTITIARLLSHHAGAATDSFAADWSDVGDGGAAYVDALRASRGDEYGGAGQRFVRPAGRAYTYSSWGMELAALVVERVTGMPYGQYVRTQIQEPLGVTAAAWPDDAGMWEGVTATRATGYATFGDVAIPSPHVGSRMYRSTGLVSTAADHVRFLAALAAGTVIGDSSMKTVLAPRGPVTYLGAPLAGYHTGLGVQLLSRKRATHRDGETYAAGHGGAYPLGYRTDGWIFFDPSEERNHLAVVALGNAWPYPGHNVPRLRTASGIISEYAGMQWREAEQGSPQRDPVRPGDASYTAGIVVAARLAAIGVREPPGDERIATMVQGAQPLRPGAIWDPEAFERGVRDMQARRTPDAISEFLESPECEVDTTRREWCALEWGAREPQDPPLIRHFAHRADESSLAQFLDYWA